MRPLRSFLFAPGDSADISWSPERSLCFPVETADAAQ